MAMEKSSIDILWVIVAAGLVFLMQGGFLCLEAKHHTNQELDQRCHEESN